MVAYTAPVFWLFFLLTGVSLFVLRRRDPAAPRPFRVPLYPLTPLVFCGSCAFLLWSSLAHAGPGAVAGVAVLATGLVPLWMSARRASLRRPAHVT
jgi:amino acid transporter